MKFTVNRSELLAALVFSSKDETRYVLNGVLIELKPKLPPTVVATDGSRMCAISTTADQHAGYEKGKWNDGVIVHPAYVRALCALSKACGLEGVALPICVEVTGPKAEGLDVRFVGSEITLSVPHGAIIEGVFPDWRKLKPDASGRKAVKDIALDSKLLADFAKAAKILGAETAAIQMNLVGNDQAVEVNMRSLSNFYGLIMQCTLDAHVVYQPEFTQIVEALGKAGEGTCYAPGAAPEADAGEAKDAEDGRDLT